MKELEAFRDRNASAEDELGRVSRNRTSAKTVRIRCPSQAQIVWFDVRRYNSAGACPRSADTHSERCKPGGSDYCLRRLTTSTPASATSASIEGSGTFAAMTRSPNICDSRCG